MCQFVHTMVVAPQIFQIFFYFAQRKGLFENTSCDRPDG